MKKVIVLLIAVMVVICLSCQTAPIVSTELDVPASLAKGVGKTDCTTIQDGILLTSGGAVIKVGYDECNHSYCMWQRRTIYSSSYRIGDAYYS